MFTYGALCVLCFRGAKGDMRLRFVLHPHAAGGEFGNNRMMEKKRKMTETLAYGFSFESAQQELFNEYQHDRV